VDSFLSKGGFYNPVFGENTPMFGKTGFNWNSFIDKNNEDYMVKDLVQKHTIIKAITSYLKDYKFKIKLATDKSLMLKVILHFKDQILESIITDSDSRGIIFD